MKERPVARSRFGENGGLAKRQTREKFTSETRDHTHTST